MAKLDKLGISNIIRLAHLRRLAVSDDIPYT